MITELLIERTTISIKTAYNINMGIDDLFVANVIDSARESVLNERNKVNKSVPSQLLQYAWLYYDASIQPYGNDGSVTVYQLPRLAQVGAGLTAPVTVMKTKGVAYPLYTSLEMYETIRRHSFSKKEDCVVLVNNTFGDQLWLYGERRNTLRCQGVFASPMQLDTFNPVTDEYPATGDMYPMIEQQIMQLYMRSLQAQAPKFVKETGVK